MKKKTLIERKKALKEAYLNELKKRGVINTPKELTKKEAVKASEKKNTKKSVKKEDTE